MNCHRQRFSENSHAVFHLIRNRPYKICRNPDEIGENTVDISTQSDFLGADILVPGKAHVTGPAGKIGLDGHALVKRQAGYFGAKGCYSTGCFMAGDNG